MGLTAFHDLQYYRLTNLTQTHSQGTRPNEVKYIIRVRSLSSFRSTRWLRNPFAFA